MSTSIRTSLRPVIQAVASASASTSRLVLSTRQISITAPSSSSSASTSTSTSPLPKSPKKPISSCPPGTVLSGLSVVKDQPDPVALPDDQYPAWLWTILEDSSVKLENDKKAGRGDIGEIDFKLRKRSLRAQNRADIKASNYLKTT